ncbi:ATP-dependent helicase [Paenibacillus silvae]|uniref:UvrD-helicase domain-containing protein n=1 Tax=Paenibacillus silvae TaxID=1325358 RepID=UPI0025A10751|nr:ATP-dependent helicase [Paenibacillus silvae]MDM5278714.1 ATP-dependent helicase [Paenibacillus silvae]
MFEELNSEQRKVVEMDGNILVTACPGSGKTRTLTAKIAFELSNIERGRHIVALTFTNRAADEIQKRIDAMNIDTERLWTGTVHSFCIEWILKPYAGYHDKTKNGFTVVDEFRQEALMNDLKSRYGFRIFENINTKFNRYGDVVNDSSRKDNLIADYHGYLNHNKLIDFDMILFISYRILVEKPKVAETLSKLFSMFLVDEYQDTSDLQYAIIGNIIRSGKGKTQILLVGDPDQAIFETLGGVAKSVIEISDEIGGYPITHCKLSGNYRSSQRIIDLYKTFQLNDLPITALGKNATDYGKITYNDRVNIGELTEEIARLIRINLNNGIPMNEICVIAPQWMLLVPMARGLKALLPDIHFDAPGLTPLPRRAENFWFKVARLFLTEPSPSMYINRVRWATEVINELSQLTGSPTSKTAKGLLTQINSIKSDKTNGEQFLTESFEELLNRLDISLDAHELLREHYISFFTGMKRRLERELSQISIDLESFKDMFKQHKGVVVNTCQGVKGEEFETVIAYGILDGLIPHSSLRRDPQAAESSSKKLLYVICSRAKTNLHLIAEEGRERHPDVNSQLNDVSFNFDS